MLPGLAVDLALTFPTFIRAREEGMGGNLRLDPDICRGVAARHAAASFPDKWFSIAARVKQAPADFFAVTFGH